MAPDAGYWRRRDIANTRAIACWLALSPAFAANGAVSFVPGSHRGEIAVHEDASARSEVAGALEIPDFQADNRNWLLLQCSMQIWKTLDPKFQIGVVFCR